MRHALREEPENDFILEADLNLFDHIIGLQFIDGSRGFVQKVGHGGSCITGRVGLYGTSSSPVKGDTVQDLLEKIRQGNYKTSGEEEYTVDVFVFDTAAEILEWLLEAERPSYKIQFRNGNH